MKTGTSESYPSPPMSFLRFASLSTALSIFVATASALEIVAHRGASHDAPENTLASLKLAWEQQADTGELDVYLTKDGRAAVIHDKTTKRTAKTDLNVASSTLEELRALEVGSWKAPQFAGEKIPTLEEALATIPDGKRMFIEIKCKQEILPEIDRVLKACGKKKEQFAVICFDYPTCRDAKVLWPEIPVYWLAAYKKDQQTEEYPALDGLIEKAKAAKLDGLNLDYKFPIDAAFVSKIKAAGLNFYVWTVNDAAVAQRMKTAGVDGIATDRPGWLREQLK